MDTGWKRDAIAGATVGAGVGAGIGARDYLSLRAIFSGIDRDLEKVVDSLKKRKGVKGWLLRRTLGDVKSPLKGKFPARKVLGGSIGTGLLVGLPTALATAGALRAHKGNKDMNVGKIKKAHAIWKQAQAPDNPYAPKPAGGSALPWVKKPDGPTVPAWKDHPASKMKPTGTWQRSAFPESP